MCLEAGHRTGIYAIIVGIVGTPEHAVIDADLLKPRQAVRLVGTIETKLGLPRHLPRRPAG